MLPRMVDARHAGQYRVWLRFTDGLTGEIDLADELWGPMFEPLKNVDMFAQVRIDPATDTVTWPNGADLSPTWLRQQLTSATSTSAAE